MSRKYESNVTTLFFVKGNSIVNLTERLISLEHRCEKTKNLVNNVIESLFN